MDQLFTSWKEIAAYLRKGVRTVQRWEHELALPVHRPGGGAKHVVFANKLELDAWVGACAHASQPNSIEDGLRKRIKVLEDENEDLRRQIGRLKGRVPHANTTPNDIAHAAEKRGSGSAA